MSHPALNVGPIGNIVQITGQEDVLCAHQVQDVRHSVSPSHHLHLICLDPGRHLGAGLHNDMNSLVTLKPGSDHLLNLKVNVVVIKNTFETQLNFSKLINE